MEFRRLKADEIEARIQQANDKFCRILLYKNARVDMAILDETVGPMNWQRSHKEIDGKIYCAVAIRDEQGTWVSKEDVGVESNIDKEKGQASDSFKRACTNWGIGRELYTSPSIVLYKDDGAYKFKDGRCYDRFDVVDIGYSEAGAINKLTLVNASLGGKVVYEYGKKRQPQKITPEHLELLKASCAKTGIPEKVFTTHYSAVSITDLTEADYADICKNGASIIKAYQQRKEAYENRRNG